MRYLFLPILLSQGCMIPGLFKEDTIGTKIDGIIENPPQTRWEWIAAISGLAVVVIAILARKYSWGSPLPQIPTTATIKIENAPKSQGNGEIAQMSEKIEGKIGELKNDLRTMQIVFGNSNGTEPVKTDPAKQEQKKINEVVLAETSEEKMP
jgi:hypothetical protein